MVRRSSKFCMLLSHDIVCSLAGDCYVCTTVKEMIPSMIYPPAEYNPAKRKTLKRPSTTRDIVDFITEYICQDVSLYTLKWRLPLQTRQTTAHRHDCHQLADHSGP